MTLLLTFLFGTLLVSFLCSILESVLMSTPLSFITMKKEQGYKLADKFLDYKTDTEKPLAAILSLNTIANTIGAAGVGRQATILFGNPWFGIISALMTLLILIFAEIVPKTIGTSYWKNMMGFATRGISILIVLMYPLVLLVSLIGKLLSNGEDDEASVSREEVTAMANIGVEEGVIDSDENKVIQNIMKLDNVQAYEAMTPRIVVMKAFVKVMNAVGVGVELIDEKCCGVAMISNGLWNSAKRHAEHNVREFTKAVEEGLPVVGVSSTCVFTMRDEYPDVLDVDNSKVRDSITLAEKYLFELVDSGKVKLVFRDDYRARIAYHVPCHMEKLGWSIFTKLLIGMIPGVSMTTLDSACCGMAGTYGFKKENYRYSQMIGRPLFEQIKSLAPDFVCCECETCKWQIEMSTSYKVLNPIVILSEALDLEATAAANRD